VTQCSANRKISPILRPFLYFGRRTKTATENRQCWISVNNLSVLAEACFARAGRILRSGNKLSPKPAIGVRHIFLGISLALREVWRTKVQGGPVPAFLVSKRGPGRANFRECSSVRHCQLHRMEVRKEGLSLRWPDRLDRRFQRRTVRVCNDIG
jgi:hypothetical protein